MLTQLLSKFDNVSKSILVEQEELPERSQLRCLWSRAIRGPISDFIVWTRAIYTKTRMKDLPRSFFSIAEDTVAFSSGSTSMKRNGVWNSLIAKRSAIHQLYICTLPHSQHRWYWRKDTTLFIQLFLGLIFFVLGIFDFLLCLIRIFRSIRLFPACRITFCLGVL